MKKFLCTLMLVAFSIGYAQQSEPIIIPVQSATYNTERQICVVLPKDYDKYPDRRYAVLYVFDAQNDRLFNLAVTTVAYLEGNDLCRR